MKVKIHKKYLLLMLLMVVNIVFCQNKVVLHHQMLSSQGTRVLTANNLFVSQSIGQLSISGNYSNDNLIVQQGFQQYGLFKTIIESPEKDGVTTSIYPNAFVDNVTVEFSSKLNGVCEVQLLDLSGKVLFRDKKEVVNNRMIIGSLGDLPRGMYILQLRALDYNCVVKLIKK